MGSIIHGSSCGKRVSRIALPVSISVLLLATSLSATSSASPRNLNTSYDATANSACQPVQQFGQSTIDPLTASNDQLQAAGFPVRPPGADAVALATWTTAMTNAKNWSAAQPICGSGSVKFTPQYSGNWAGHVANNTSFGNVNFTWSQSTWTQTSVPGDSNYTDFQNAPDSAMWTGLGITSLIQAGIASISTSTAQYRFWTEDFPNPPVFEGPVIRPGNVAYVYVEYLGNNTAYYFLENETTGSYQSFNNSAPYVGWRAANYINERVQGYYLPNFGSVGIAGNSFGTSTNTWSLTSALNQAWVMTSNCLSTGNGLSVPSTVQSDSSFYQHWYQGSPFTDNC